MVSYCYCLDRACGMPVHIQVRKRDDGRDSPAVPRTVADGFDSDFDADGEWQPQNETESEDANAGHDYSDTQYAEVAHVHLTPGIFIEGLHKALAARFAILQRHCALITPDHHPLHKKNMLAAASSRT